MTDHVWTAGQKVALFGGYGAQVARLMRVDRVTPSGRAVINRTQYNTEGYEIGVGRYSRQRIVPWTDEHAVRLRASQIQAAKDALRHTAHIPAPVLREAVEIVLTERTKAPK